MFDDIIISSITFIIILLAVAVSMFSVGCVVGFIYCLKVPEVPNSKEDKL